MIELEFLEETVMSYMYSIILEIIKLGVPAEARLPQNIPYTRYIWRTISLVNRDVVHIGGHFSLANKVIEFIQLEFIIHAVTRDSK